MLKKCSNISSQVQKGIFTGKGGADPKMLQSQMFLEFDFTKNKLKNVWVVFYVTRTGRRIILCIEVPPEDMGTFPT